MTSILYDVRARWYDASTHQFISQDPSGFSAGDANLYRYVGNDPANYTDPMGLAKNWYEFFFGKPSTGPSRSDQLAAANPELAQAFQSVKSQNLQTLAPINEAAAAVSAVPAGIKTGIKAEVNGSGQALYNTATLGLGTRQIQLLSVTEEDRAGGYNAAVGSSTFGNEILIGLGTGGVASILSKGGRIARSLGGGLILFDAAGNSVNVAKGSIDIAENELTLQNGLQVTGGLLGLGANVAAFKSLNVVPSNGTYYHSTSPGAVRPIIEGGFRTDIPNPQAAFHNNRFGRGVYLADSPASALAERPAGVVLEVGANLGKSLDILNRGPILDTDLAKAIARGRESMDLIRSSHLQSGQMAE